MNRREFVALSAMCASERVLPAQSAADVTLRFTKPARPVVVPADFTGLGYETSSPAQIGLLSVKNTVYLNLVRGLGRSGTMRFGGIVGDHTRYIADGSPKFDKDDTVMTHAAIAQAAEFLRAAGWKAIWSVNFGTGTLENAVAELRDIAATLGDRLLAVEIGNEVEEYGKHNPPHRPGGYTYEQYRAEYAVWHKAIAAAVPGLRFAAPDTAQSVEWVEQMAADNAGTVQLLTTHYYRAGQKQAQTDQLRTLDPRLANVVARLRVAAEKSGLPWRMCETNSYSGGGHPGLSDSLLGALWTLDYMLYLATNGCSGVNMETGVNQLGFVSSYSPIQDDGQGHNSAGAPYYGMLAAKMALSGERNAWDVTLGGAPRAVTAYGFGGDASPEFVVVVNRDAQADVSVHSDALQGFHCFALAETDKIRFGGAIVQADGRVNVMGSAVVRDGFVKVPHSSAVVLARRFA
jgi:hypothetical protein